MRFFLFLLTFCFYLNSTELIKPSNYNNENVIGWIMSEKLDGIRGYYDGKNLYTRDGNLINAPKWFLENFPPFALDGELWTKRNDFENIQSIVMDKIPSDKWKMITYNVFEVPDFEGDFFARIEKIKNYLKTNPSDFIKIIPQYNISSKKELDNFFEKITLENGEGIIVKDPTKSYHTGRSSYIFKIKPTNDMEGIVIGYNLNSDKSLKSLIIKLENGVIFNLGNGFKKEQRLKPPKIGEIITFKYYGFTKNGKPKFASFLHIRKD